MLAKPKSAPVRRSRMKFKWFTSKTNAMKEIEAWAKEGESGNPGLGHVAARVSGQLTDNVTEERMLQAKILDLSKERYKFLSHNSYEKKSFLDKQRRKAPVLKFLLREVNIDSNKFYLPINSRDHGKTSGLKSQISYLGSYRHRSNGRNIRDGKSAVSESCMHGGMSRRDRPVTTDVTSSKNSELSSRATTRTAPPALPTVFPTEPKIKNNRLVDSNENHHQRLPKMQKSVGLPEPGKLFTTPSPRASPRPKSRYSAVSKRSGARSARNVPTADPRYRELEKLLCENYDSDVSSAEVTRIVNKMDALHLPPKKPKEAKPRMTVKIQQFMQERGIAF